MGAKVKKYHLPPTTLIPNSPLPLLHYPGLLSAQTSLPDGALQIHDLFSQNGWQVQWIFRYGTTQDAHYHSAAHEAMVVLSGEATIRFGASDQAEILLLSKNEGDNSNNSSDGKRTTKTTKTMGNVRIPPSPPPLELHASRGDVFILPAGVAHKTFHTSPPSAGLKLLTPGDGHGLGGGGGKGGDEGKVDPRKSLVEVKLDGFTMMGAYPLDGGEWDFNVGGEHQGKYGEIWKVARPERDPVLGKDPDGLCGLWKG